jgi:hypothetical protein
MSEQVNVEENNEPKNIFKEVIENPQEHDCSICHEQLIIDDPESTKFMKSWLEDKTCKFHKPVYVTSCNHAFHGDCLLEYHYHTLCEHVNQVHNYVSQGYQIMCPCCRDFVEYVTTYTHYNLNNGCKYRL